MVVVVVVVVVVTVRIKIIFSTLKIKNADCKGIWVENVERMRNDAYILFLGSELQTAVTRDI